MPQTAATVIYLFSTLFWLSLIPWTSAGFSLKLIHRDSPLSPIYQSNLSDYERLMININISEARASYFQQHNELMDERSIRLPLKLYAPIFTVEIGIGTPAVKRTLIFDTGSGITWTQCKPCPKCFKQNEPLFDPKSSTSYKPIAKNHRLARSFKCSSFGGCCTSSGCSYRERYYSGQATAGAAATEAFTFLTNAGAPTTVSNMAFGCGKSSSGAFPPQISGILGLSRQPVSFARQLGSVIKGRFSYCLSDTKASYVRFGDEAVIRGRNVQRSPFLSYTKSDTIYGLELNDLSINGQKLGLSRAVFPNGCFIDSGSSVSLLNKRALATVKAFLDRYFAQFNNVRQYAGNKAPKGFLCYTHDGGFSKFPTLQFHFHGADFDVPVGNLFMYIDNNVFCMAMRESKGLTILGAHQQRNVRILYDLNEMMLSFAPDDCSRDGASSMLITTK